MPGRGSIAIRTRSNPQVPAIAVSALNHVASSGASTSGDICSIKCSDTSFSQSQQPGRGFRRRELATGMGIGQQFITVYYSTVQNAKSISSNPATRILIAQSIEI